MKKILLALSLLVGSVASAAAACTGPAVMHDFAGTPFNMSLGTAPDTNCESITAAADASQTFSITSSTTSTALALQGTQSVQFNLTGTFSATVLGQVSNDNTNWVSVPLFNMTSGAWIAPATGATVVGNYMLAGTQGARYARVSVTFTSGTVAGAVTATAQGPSATWGDYLNWLALTGSSTCLAATSSTTNSYSNGNVASVNCGLHGGVYIDPSQVVTTGGATTANSLSNIWNSQYPVNSVTTTPTPLVAKGTGTTGAVTGTLTPASTATAYVCGFSFSAIGGTANPGPLVLSGLLGGSFTYQLAPNSATIAQNFSQTFSPCLPASAVNTAIVLTTTAATGATATDVNIWGYGL